MKAKLSCLLLAWIIGHVRATDDDTPPFECLDPNEVFDYCVKCESTCRIKDPTVCNKWCIPGCTCRKGFLRDQNNWECVEEDECTLQKPVPWCYVDNEEYAECGGNEPSCSDPEPTPDFNCVEGCFCKLGFYRDEDGSCVPLDECSDHRVARQADSQTCPRNEEFSFCVGCESTCRIENPTVCNKWCIPGCTCKTGFLRDQNTDLCVKKRNCTLQEPVPWCFEDNEEYAECGGCEPSCYDPDPTCDFKCVEGCFCKLDYYRDEDGSCVPLDECSDHRVARQADSQTCPKNEKFDYCVKCESTCRIQDPTVCNKWCIPGCTCKTGFLRDQNTDLCVKKRDCTLQKPVPWCFEDNEEYAECGGCEPSCSDPNPTCDFKCVEGCFCELGYYRDEDGSCVPLDECSDHRVARQADSQTCPKNEKFDYCVKCESTCRIQDPTVCNKWCIPGCTCLTGLLRDQNTGLCVQKNGCTLQKPVPWCYVDNEEYAECGGNEPSCSDPEPTPDFKCVEGCFCKLGFYRDEDGRCVRRNECLERRVARQADSQTCGENEEFDNCVKCIRTCQIPNPVFCRRWCVPECVCKKGYLRDENTGRCVLPRRCTPQRPVPSCYYEHEVYTNCGGCEPSCSDPDPQCRFECVVGCFCDKDYVRDETTGECILPFFCPRNNVGYAQRYRN